MPSRTDVLGRLARLVTLVDVDSYALGDVLREHPDDVAELLGWRPAQVAALATLADVDLVPLLLPTLGPALTARRETQKQEQEMRAFLGARALGDSARWVADQAWVDPAVLLGEVVRTRAEGIRFRGGAVDICLLRHTIVEVRRALGHRQDLGVFVDSAGLHVRWKNHRGRLNLRPLPERSTVAHEALTVWLRPAHHQADHAVLLPAHAMGG